MNKKLIKTIASITCGLGIVGTMPLVATSCKKINYFAPYLTLNGGSDESISYADDYVDFIVNEPASKTYKDRSHNGHSASFEVTLGDRTTVKSWLNEYDPDAPQEPLPDPDWKQEWPKYGFHYDKENDQWHYKFRVKDIPTERATVKVTVYVTVDDETLGTPSEFLYFFPVDPSKAVIEQGSITNYTMTINSENYSTYSIESLAETFLVQSSKTTGGPSDNDAYSWAQTLVDSDFTEIYGANMFAFLYAVEALNFIQYCNEVSDVDMRFAEWQNNTYLTPNNSTKLTSDQIKNLSVTIEMIDVHNVTDNKKEFYTNCSTIIKIGEDQKEAIAAYCDPDDYTYDKVSPPVMCTSNIYTIESEGAMYLENIGHKFTGNWDNSQFIIHMNGNLFSEVPGQNYQLFNAFHYITISDQKIGSPTQIPCFFTDGMKTLLEAVFPEYPNINPVINQY